MSSTTYTQAEIESAHADVYRQGREHAINASVFTPLSEKRINRVRVMVAGTLNRDPQIKRLTPAQLEHLVDGYTEGYSLGLDERGQILEDSE